MLKFRKIVVVILIIFLLNTLFCNCYATFVTVTKENLNESLQKLISTDEDYINDKITVSDKVITLTTDGKNYSLNYDLTNKPTFSFEIPIQKGMSYADFEDQTDSLYYLPFLGYIAVANIQGLEFEEATTYFMMTYLSGAFNGSWSSEDSYVIVDDTDLSDGVTIKGDSKTIYASEFGERVMEYVNATYEELTTVTDKTSGINSYELTIEKKDVTETSCKLVSSLTVNVDADFSKIKEYDNQEDDSNKDTSTEKDDSNKDTSTERDDSNKDTATEKDDSNKGTATEKDNSNNSTATEKDNSNKGTSTGQTQQSSGTSKDDTTVKGTLPKTGISNSIYIIIMVSCFISLVIFGVKLIKNKDIK